MNSEDHHYHLSIYVSIFPLTQPFQPYSIIATHSLSRSILPMKTDIERVDVPSQIATTTFMREGKEIPKRAQVQDRKAHGIAFH
jgi:hypothetical protein